MKQVKILFPAMLILTGYMVSAQKSNDMNWMLGSWSIDKGKGQTIIEEWKIQDDSTLTGTSIFYREGRDPIPQETMTLSYRDGHWYYIPAVPSQNGGAAIPFKLIFNKGTEFISENPDHDFPTRINYRRINNQMYASIEGPSKGKYSKINFNFTLKE